MVLHIVRIFSGVVGYCTVSRSVRIRLTRTAVWRGAVQIVRGNKSRALVMLWANEVKSTLL